MLGAIIGDIVGSRFEFDPTNDYNFELFTPECSFTDDTICTVAVADAILQQKDYGETIHSWCRRYPHPKGAYGGRFKQWVNSDHPHPYGSYGNGSAMRVSPVGWAFPNAVAIPHEAQKSAECTHNHPEGIKGAQAVALAIHKGDEIRRLCDKVERQAILSAISSVAEYYGYNINIRREQVLNRFDETCQGTVPVALWIITESIGFEDAIRKAVSLGADADTLGAIVGSIAEAIWGVPESLALEAMSYLPSEMKSVVLKFYRQYMWEMCPIKGYGDEGAAEDLLLDMEQQEDEEANLNQVKAVMRWKLGLGTMNGLLQGNDGLPSKEKTATADSWNTEPMPEDRSAVSNVETRILVTPERMDILRKGHIPEVQEDHWFMYCTDDCIRYYRSWTGMCAYEAYYHEENHRFVIDKVRMNHNLVEFGVNGDEAGLALFRYLIAAETGFNAEEAWAEYIIAWEQLYQKYSIKPKHEPKVADPWYTGTKGKVCEGCIYAGGIRRLKDSVESELMGCGRCCRNTFKESYISGHCKFRKTDLYVPSEFEKERIEYALKQKKEKEQQRNAKKHEFEEKARGLVLLKSTYSAGTTHAKNQSMLKCIELYDRLELVRECDNKYDDNAVALHYHGIHVGYVPRNANSEIAALLVAGYSCQLEAYVTKKSSHSGTTFFDFNIYLKPDSSKDDTEYIDNNLRTLAEKFKQDIPYSICNEMEDHGFNTVNFFVFNQKIYCSIFAEENGISLPTGLPVVFMMDGEKACPLTQEEISEVLRQLPDDDEK